VMQRDPCKNIYILVEQEICHFIIVREPSYPASYETMDKNEKMLYNVDTIYIPKYKRHRG